MVRLCAFDLDHTLVRSSLDLAAMALDIRAFLERRCGPLPPRPERYRVGELVAWCQAHAPEYEGPVWDVALEHERRALGDATLEPGARQALAGARAAGFRTVVWTNNARAVAMEALGRFALTDTLDLVVARDDVQQLKPDPDGWRVIAAHFALDAAAETYMVGDSWVDGLAAARAGVPFVAYRARAADLARWQVTALAYLDDLAALPAWLSARLAPA